MRRAVLAGISSLTVALASLIGTASAAAADSRGSVPFTDPQARGLLTFCDRHGHAVTSGSLQTRPFAWKTISSAPSPATYRTTSARASMAAYQPIQYEDPSDWSGGPLTGASSFTNPAHPASQATNLDAALLGFVQGYPPHWDHLVQIRMLYSGVGLPVADTYAAAVLRITGDTWTVVQGGTTSCAASRGTSDETRILSKRKLGTPVAAVPAGSPTASAAKVGGTTTTTDTSATTDESDAANAARRSSSDGLSVGESVGIGLAVIFVLGLGGTALLAWRRRRSGA